MSWHYLRTNKRSGNPRYFVLIDTETRTEQLTPTRRRLTFRLGCIRHATIGADFETEVWHDAAYTDRQALIDGMVEHCKRGQRTIAVAYNWDFDYSVLDVGVELGRRGWECTRDVRTRGAWHQSWRKWGEPGHKQPYRLDLFDLAAIYRQPLANLGPWLGLHKVELPADVAGEDAWLARCWGDIELTHAALLKWLRWRTYHDMGAWRPTLAATSAGCYRHRFMKYRLLHHNDELATALESEAYMGGRVEALYLGELPRGEYSLADVQALYPSVMAAERMPVELRGTIEHCTIEQLRTWVIDWICIARVEVNTQRPCLPYRRDGHLQFPIGRFVTTLAGAELEYALTHELIADVDAAALYHPAELFKEWVAYWWEVRRYSEEHGDTVAVGLVKRIMNSLCGKFAQRLTTEKLLYADAGRPDEEWTEIDYPEGIRHDFRAVNGRVYELFSERFADNAVPAISACINAAGRMALWRYMELAGLAHVYYVDTDALIVDKAGRKALEPEIEPGRPGALVWQKWSRDAAVWGRKWYELGGLTRAAGVKRDAVWLDRDYVEQDNWRSSTEAAKANLTPGAVIDRQRLESPARPIRALGAPLGRTPIVALAETLQTYRADAAAGRANSAAY